MPGGIELGAGEADDAPFVERELPDLIILGIIITPFDSRPFSMDIAYFVVVSFISPSSRWRVASSNF